MTAHKIYNKCLKFRFVSAFFCLLLPKHTPEYVCVIEWAIEQASVCRFVYMCHVLVATWTFLSLIVFVALTFGQSVNSSACIDTQHVNFQSNTSKKTFLVCLCFASTGFILWFGSFSSFNKKNVLFLLFNVFFFLLHFRFVLFLRLLFAVYMHTVGCVCVLCSCVSMLLSVVLN